MAAFIKLLQSLFGVRVSSATCKPNDEAYDRQLYEEAVKSQEDLRRHGNVSIEAIVKQRRK